jgi:hypothetical protein
MTVSVYNQKQLKDAARIAVRYEAQLVGVKARLVDWHLELVGDIAEERTRLVSTGQRPDGFRFQVCTRL